MGYESIPEGERILELNRDIGVGFGMRNKKIGREMSSFGRSF